MGKHDDPVAEETHSVALIACLAQAAQGLFDKALAPFGLRKRHLVALTYLRENGPTAQQALASAISLDPSNLVGLLNELEERELVLRRHAPGDRRRHIVEITRKGERALDQDVHRSLESVEEQLLGSLSAEEREVLHSLLQRATSATPEAEAAVKAVKAKRAPAA